MSGGKDMNFNFVKPEVYYEGEVEYGKPFRLFVEPLPKGFGETLATPLRRILLTFLPGTGVIGFKIDGVVHEMQEIPNAASDTIQLIQNLKLVRFQIDGDTEEVKTVTLKRNKKGPVYAKDLKVPEGVKVLNEDQEILLLTEDTEFQAEFYIQKGYGYKKSDDHIKLKDKKGAIRIDTSFSPVQSVGYEVKTARVGDEANYDKIIYLIRTDGSVHPKEAVELAIHLMISFYSLFLESSDVANKTKLYKEKEKQRNLLLDTPVELLNLSQRSYNALKRAEINVVRDLVDLDKKTLSAINQLGRKSVDEIIEVLEKKGIYIAD